MEQVQESARIELIGKTSAGLSLIEIGLGSVLHAYHVPLSGDFLSLNQGFLLCRASAKAKAQRLGRVGYSISNVAAVLKSLSPAGKKLGPMLSLSAQGLLFSLGELFFGQNLAGWMLGMVLLSLWTVVFQLTTYYLLFGPDLFKGIGVVADKLLHVFGFGLSQILWALGALVALKAVLGIGLAFLAWRSRGDSQLQDRILALAETRGAEEISPRQGAPLWLALKDLFRPLFLGSLAVTCFFLYFSEKDLAGWIWVLLRPVAIGFLFFYLSRTLTLDRWLRKLHGTRGEEFARACQRALVELRQFRRKENSSRAS